MSNIGLLLWKNYILHKRKWVVTLLELLLPCLALFILLSVRQLVSSDNQSNPTYWKAFEYDKLPEAMDPSFSSWTIAFTPNTTANKNMMDKVVSSIEGVTGSLGFNDEAEMEKYFSLVKNQQDDLTLAGVVFLPSPSPSLQSSQIADVPLNYKLRFPYKLRKSAFNAYTEKNPFKNINNWLTNLMYPLKPMVGPRDVNATEGGVPGYYREGFLALQNAVDRAIIHTIEEQDSLNGKNGTGRRIDQLRAHMQLQRTPYPPYLKDDFILVIQDQLPFLIVLAFMFSSLNIVKNVVYEKEKRLKESLKMMGISSLTHWNAWFITYSLLHTVTIFLMVICMSIFIPPNGRIINKSDPTVLFVFLWIYSFSVVTFCFAVSVFFKSANAGAAAGGILFFASFLPYNYVRNRYHSYTLTNKMAMSLVPNLAMSLGSRLVGMFEGQDVGVQWSNVATGINVDESFCMLHVFIMLAVDTLLYLTIAWYVENVAPGEFGVPKPWYFPVESLINCVKCSKKSSFEAIPQEVLEDSLRMRRKEFFQEEPTNVTPGVQIRGLSKVFGRGQHRLIAVNNLNLNMYQGQITVLLGHNGAGKTTTMSMLTGFIPPTIGTAMICGYDIRQDLGLVQKNLGLCPQHDVLFDQLSVAEHLVFFAKLKGVKGISVDVDVEDMLTRVNLVNKRHTLAMNLSGGMRRRLSIGIALIGGSQVVILDEPTSGLDPDARRELWTLLQQERASRTMLLTTHFMDEADVLGDRVAIMAAGEVQCCGTPLFLKNKYGADYHLTLVKTEQCDEAVLFQLIRSHVAEFRVESNVSDELDLLLPATASHLFETLFQEIEDRMTELGIRSYGVSITTMEEVFLKVGNYQEEQQAHQESVLKNQEPSEVNKDNLHGTNNGTTSNFGGDEPLQFHASGTSTMHLAVDDSAPSVRGVFLFLQQMAGLLMKRSLCFIRNKVLTLAQMIIPVAFTIVGLVIMRTVPVAKTLPPLALNLDKFNVLTLPYNVMSGPAANFTLEQQDVTQRFLNIFRNRQVATTILQPMPENFASFDDFLLSQAQRDIFKFDIQYLVGAEFMAKPSQNSIQDSNMAASQTELWWRGVFNNQPYHTPAMLLNAMNNALLQFVTADPSRVLTTINHPMPKTSDDKLNDLILEESLAFTVALNLLFGMSFLAGSIVPFLIRERATRAKHLQYLAGVMSGSYWLSTFLWDLVNFMLPSLLVILVFVAFNEPAYTGEGRVGVVLLLLLLYAFSVIPLMYLLSHFFAVPSTGLVWLVIFNIISGSVTLLTVNILRIPQLNLQDVSETLNWIFLVLLPNYCLGQGMADIYINHLFLDICMKDDIRNICFWKLPHPCCSETCAKIGYCAEYNLNYLGWKSSGIGRMLVFLAIQGVIFFTILFFKETSIFNRVIATVRMMVTGRLYRQTPRTTTITVQEEQTTTRNGNDAIQFPEETEDDDVLAERGKLQNANLDLLKNEYSLILSEVTKVYGSLTAVNHISCSVPTGKCFGLLGVNGAGKTTTFKMITGDLPLTSGEIYINGYNLRTQRRVAQRSLGYCPQFDALIEEMTGKEVLTFFAMLRGIPRAEIPGEVQRLLYDLNLSMYANVRCGEYSGGNKRKLSTALSLVGSPALVCLDEPTTGMDPVSRRQLWNTLTKYRNQGHTLVLTSHSMEECEALCTNIAIMVNGKFQCLGTCQYLKSKFAEGYTLLVQVTYPTNNNDEGEENVQRMLQFVSEEFTSEVKDRHQGHVHLYVPRAPHITWSRIFGTMERNVNRLHIVYYSVTQTSLEQVFLGFARNQTPPRDTEFNCCRGGCWGRG